MAKLEEKKPTSRAFSSLYNQVSHVFWDQPELLELLKNKKIDLRHVFNKGYSVSLGRSASFSESKGQCVLKLVVFSCSFLF